ncbi:MAG: efflux RND transporter periplasmic adaptor subunit [Planctomycetes bacterium]|nr:efflux RND transporter periplasmic adaptor subunit [Planctomycetota bacterium]
MKLRRLVLPLLSLAGMAVAATTVISANTHKPPAPLVSEPARSGFARRVAGAGIVESASENVSVGAPVSALVREVRAQRGERVAAGAPLFALDDRALKAQRGSREAALRAARSELARLEALPRPEDLPPARARVDGAFATLEHARSELGMVEALIDARAVSHETVLQRRNAVREAEAAHAVAKAELERLEAGAWEADLEIARASIDRAQAAVAELDTEIELRTVRAPIAGTVLQLDVRPGEYVEAGSRRYLVLGDLAWLHVRADVDENDAWRVKPGAKARAFVRGNGELSTDLEFVRIDPYVLPKRSLTGDTLERVDTRVLQVVFRFPTDALPVYVGQQMDVYIEVSEAAGAKAGR